MKKIINFINKLKDWQVLTVGLFLLIISITISFYEAGIFMTVEEFPKSNQQINYVFKFIKGFILMMTSSISGGFIGVWILRKWNK